MFNRTVLNNGVRVVTENLPFVQSAALGIWVKTGSRNENSDEHGISHFIEHLKFKGTERRTALDIAEDLEQVGGEINAFTAKEYTCYHVRVLNEYLPLAVEVLFDMLLNSKYSEESIEKEKNVILEEISAVEDTPEEIVHDYFEETLWKGHPLARNILGTINSVRDINRKKIIDYIDRQYVGNNIVVAAAGNISHEYVAEIVRDALGDIKKGFKNIYEPPNSNYGVKIVSKTSEQIQVCFGIPAVGYESESIYALTALNTVIGGGLSSRLFQEIREEKGLVYSIDSYNMPFLDCGLWGIQAGTSRNNVLLVLDLCLEILSDLKENNIKIQELEKSKKQLKGELLISMESTVNQMARIGRSELMRSYVMTLDEVVDKINSITLDDTEILINELFESENFALAAVGPYREELDLKSLCAKAGI